jgi:hypothetical protein
MKAEAKANEDADKKEREKVDKLNQADSMIFTTENFLKDNGDKIPADKKPAIEDALNKLKDAHKAAGRGCHRHCHGCSEHCCSGCFRLRCTARAVLSRVPARASKAVPAQVLVQVPVSRTTRRATTTSRTPTSRR